MKSDFSGCSAFLGALCLFANGKDNRYEEWRFASITSTLEDMRTVSPALEHYAVGTLLGDLWTRPQLSSRDRSIVTLSVMHNKLIFDSSEAITHAMNSPVRHQMRADFEKFPPFEGNNVHHPMSARTFFGEAR